MASSLITIGFLKQRVYPEPANENIEVFNEIFVLLIQYHLLTFSDMVKPAETRSMMGISCVVITSICILADLIVIVKGVCVAIKFSIKKRIKTNVMQKRERQKLLRQ